MTLPRRARHLEALSHWLAVAATIVALAVTLAACGSSSAARRIGGEGHGTIQVVAAENDWGSIASQIGGVHVHVTSIITDPNADPHVYEPTPADGRTVASADLVWYNGIGYDNWVPRLLGADLGARKVLEVGAVLGVGAGGNPHRWYNPADVAKVIRAYVADLSSLEPGDAGYFEAQARQFDTVDLRHYDQLIANIKARYAGTPVGASESIFSMLAPSLGLDLVTPRSFLEAISEGTDVVGADKATIDHQIKDHLIKAYIYNSQNTTPDVQAQLAECSAVGIPTATITETLTPASASYQRWQSRQLQGIEAALAHGTGK